MSSLGAGPMIADQHHSQIDEPCRADTLQKPGEEENFERRGESGQAAEQSEDSQTAGQDYSSPETVCQ